MIKPPVAIIASLFPARLGPVKRALFSPQRTYEIEPCEDLNTPQILVVHQQSEEPYMGLGRTALRTWEGYQVADDILNEMKSGLPGTNSEVGAEPGVWISVGAYFADGKWVIPQEEIAEHRKQLNLTLRRLIMIARELHNKGEGRSILPVMHKAAEFSRITGEKWQQDLSSDARTKCPFCTQIVDLDGEGLPPICIGCKQIINKPRYERVVAMTMRAETAIEGIDLFDDVDVPTADSEDPDKQPYMEPVAPKPPAMTVAQQKAAAKAKAAAAAEKQPQPVGV